MEIALWPQTRERWQGEGMPEGIKCDLMHGCGYFGLEGYDALHIDAALPYPPMPERVLSEDADTVTFTDAFGRTRRARKSGMVGGSRMSMDAYIEFPVRDRTSWRSYRKRYEGDHDKRYPTDWRRQKDRLARTDNPRSLLDPLAGTFGYYSMLRNWMGTQGLSYMFYDDPALVQECLEFLTDFAVGLLAPALREIRFDFYYIHEDMACKGGPLVSPEMFRRLFLPQYRRFIGFLRSNGIDLVLVDSDGDHEVLVPTFLEAGVNGFGPVERAAGMDPVRLRRKYGKDVVMIGGVDKREIAKGRRAIDREIDRSIRPIVDEGGFIPTIDHSIPPDVSLDNFRYYLERKRRLLGA